jgi:tRNA (guanine-N7-)-methyltransferase
MLEAAELTSTADFAEIVPVNYFAPLDLRAIYGCGAPFEVDLGCGDGLFLTAAAGANPMRNYLGIERLAGRVRSACHKITTRKLTNARILRCDLAYAVRHLMPPGCVAVFHLMFPDPWPKRRHASRRIVSENFLNSLNRALAPGGTIRIATDQIEYFREIERVVARSSPSFIPASDRTPSEATSTFEERFRRKEIEIHRLVLRKVSDVM